MVRGELVLGVGGARLAHHIMTEAPNRDGWREAGDKR
jgi:hypothetical protein